MNNGDLFSTNDLKNWLPYYADKGERIIDAMAHHSVNYIEFYDFFQKHGDLMLQFIEKLTIDELKGEKFRAMTDVQRGFIGHTAFLSFMKELSVEVYAEQVEKAKKEEE